jgi:PQQ-dependent catabolism-associated CXXCW motif protein
MARPYRREVISRGLGNLAFALSVSVALMAATSSVAHAAEFDPATGYRIERYRSHVPQTVEGGTRINAADVSDLIKTKNALLIDVMPSEGIGPDPATGAWRSFKARKNLPGSHWLADVGKGVLTPEFEAYFKDHLERLTEGHRDRAIIIYCQADCWMSWNAVRRASKLGYSSLYWFADGTDGWRDWDGSTVDAIPEPLALKRHTP